MHNMLTNDLAFLEYQHFAINSAVKNSSVDSSKWKLKAHLVAPILP